MKNGVYEGVPVEWMGKVCVAASSRRELTEAVAAVRANLPVLAQFVRLKEGPVLGFVSAIDHGVTPPRVQINDSEGSWIGWDRLEYA